MPFPSNILRTLAITGACALAACATQSERTHRDSNADDGPWPTAHAKIAAMLTGSFSSEAQSLTDENFFDIRLEVVSIWPSRDDGPWLYVEQAAASALSRPYRQRVYHIVGSDTAGYRNEVYELPGDALSFAGAWKSSMPLSGLAPGHLVQLEGCTVYLQPTGEGLMSGGTRASECGTDWGGAAYATSEVTLALDYMESWDRGYDAQGEQVWGAVTGPYRFDRIATGAADDDGR